MRAALWLNLGITLVLSFGLVRASIACDRPRLDRAVLVAGAESVFVGRVIEVTGEHTARVQATEILKGSPPKVLSIQGLVTSRKSRFEPCTALIIEADKSYVFAMGGSGTDARLADLLDGAASLAELDSFRAAVQLSGRASGVRKAGALRARLLSKKARYAASEDIDLYVELENASQASQTLEVRFWPPEKHTFCDLEITDGRKPVTSRPNPIDPAGIRDYFSKHANNHDLSIAPGGRHRIHLQRINSAKPGWGYKEDLGFRFYPLDEGAYRIRAICHRLLTEAIETDSIQIAVGGPE